MTTQSTRNRLEKIETAMRKPDPKSVMVWPQMYDSDYVATADDIYLDGRARLPWEYSSEHQS